MHDPMWVGSKLGGLALWAVPCVSPPVCTFLETVKFGSGASARLEVDGPEVVLTRRPVSRPKGRIFYSTPAQGVGTLSAAVVNFSRVGSMSHNVEVISRLPPNLSDTFTSIKW